MEVITGSKYSLGENLLSLLHTTLGLVIMAKFPIIKQANNQNTNNSNRMRKSWEVEQPHDTKCKNPKHEVYKSHFKTNYKRVKSWRQ